MAEPKKVEELPEKYPPVFDDELGEEEEEEEEVVEKAVEEEDVSDEDEEEPEGEEEVEDLTEQREKSAGDKRTLRVSGITHQHRHTHTV